MMELTDNDLRNFQVLYQKYYGKELDRDTAYQKLSFLVRQMELVYRPITPAQADEVNKANGGTNEKVTSSKSKSE